MIKRTIFAFLCTASLATYASDSIFLGRVSATSDEDKEFVESPLPLPPVPDANQSDWLDLYISPTFSGQPRILLSSLSIADDGSIRYVFNNRSAKGYDNITAEGFLCITGSRLLDSEGSRLKTFAYADTINNRWITPRQSNWQTLGGKLNSNDSVHRVLYDTFCIDGKAKNEQELQQRLRNLATKKYKPNYQK